MDPLVERQDKVVALPEAAPVVLNQRTAVLDEEAQEDGDGVLAVLIEVA